MGASWRSGDGLQGPHLVSVAADWLRGPEQVTRLPWVSDQKYVTCISGVSCH